MKLSLYYNFSWKINLVCGLLAICMFRAAFWQYERYLWKQGIINELYDRLETSPVPLEDLLEKITKYPNDYVHRRVIVSGNYDFSQEIILRNRRMGNMPGVYSVVPLKITGTEQSILVNRGFIPLSISQPEKRSQYDISRQGIPSNDDQSFAKFVGLLKASSTRRWLGPKDLENSPANPLDAWLWFDIQQIKQQLPYENILPLSLEIIPESYNDLTVKDLILQGSGKAELFDPTSGAIQVARSEDVPDLPFPLAVFDPIVPAGRHFGYIFEWSFLALLTLAIGFILQLRRNSSET